MTDSKDRISDFVAAVRKQVNRHRWWTSLTWAVVAGTGCFVVVALWYVLRGYSVPFGWIAVCLFATVVAAVAARSCWSLRRDDAAEYADNHFGLKDATISSLHFADQECTGGYYDLQATQTDRQILPLDVSTIPYKPPRRGITLAAGLVAVAIPLSLKGPSEAALEETRIAETTQQQTETINEELAELVEQLNEETVDPDEKELVDPDKLRKWVDELKSTTDPKEALRQYARLERKLNEARLASQRKEEERLLDRTAEALRKARETERLGETLQQKKYDKASAMLQKMNSAKSQSLDKRRRDLARLKAATQRMAAATRAAKNTDRSGSASSSSPSSSKDANSAGGSRSASSGSGGSGEGNGEMATAIEDLANSVAELDDALKDAERQAADLGESDAETKSQCESCEQCVSDRLSKLCKKLDKLSMCRKAEKKLSRLCKKCSQCQGGLCSSVCNSPNAGGLKAGWGSNAAQRDERDEIVDNGQTTRLKGTKGAGPSLTTVESADDGSGVSTRRSVAKTRNFQRQFESFVAREDVPEQVRDGVKHYFEIIHQFDSASADTITTPGDNGK